MISDCFSSVEKVWQHRCNPCVEPPNLYENPYCRNVSPPSWWPEKIRATLPPKHRFGFRNPSPWPCVALDKQGPTRLCHQLQANAVKRQFRRPDCMLIAPLASNLGTTCGHSFLQRTSATAPSSASNPGEPQPSAPWLSVARIASAKLADRLAHPCSAPQSWCPEAYLSILGPNCLRSFNVVGQSKRNLQRGRDGRCASTCGRKTISAARLQTILSSLRRLWGRG